MISVILSPFAIPLVIWVFPVPKSPVKQMISPELTKVPIL